MDLNDNGKYLLIAKILVFLADIFSVLNVCQALCILCLIYSFQGPYEVSTIISTFWQMEKQRVTEVQELTLVTLRASSRTGAVSQTYLTPEKKF